MDNMVDWDSLKEKIEGSDSLSGYKQKYLLRLVAYGQEYTRLEQLHTAQVMYNRIVKQMETKFSGYKKINFKGDFSFSNVTSALHDYKIDEAVQFLEKHAGCLAEEEKKIFTYQIMGYKKPKGDAERSSEQPLNPTELDSQKYLPGIQKERINSLRNAMLERVVRFRKKQKDQTPPAHVKDGDFPDVVGLYNNKFNVCEVLDRLSEVDADLVADLKNHYQKIDQLSRLFS